MKTLVSRNLSGFLYTLAITGNLFSAPRTPPLPSHCHSPLLPPLMHHTRASLITPPPTTTTNPPSLTPSKLTRAFLFSTLCCYALQGRWRGWTA